MVRHITQRRPQKAIEGVRQLARHLRCLVSLPCARLLRREGIAGRSQSKENIRAHEQSPATRLKLCFPFFCWQHAHPLSLEQIVCEATVYQSSALMVHFFQAFRYTGGALPQFSPVSKLIDIANASLYQMKGQVRSKQHEFPQVS
jgi:hypothetical protein